DSLPEVLFRALEVPLLTEENTEIVQRFRKVRANLQRPLISLQRVAHLARLEQNVSKVVQRVSVIGPRLERGTEARQRPLNVAALPEKGAERVIGCGVIRLEGERVLQGALRIRRATEFHVERAEVVERNGARVRFGDALECARCRRIESLLGQLQPVLKITAVARRRCKHSSERN